VAALEVFIAILQKNTVILFEFMSDYRIVTSVGLYTTCSLHKFSDHYFKMADHSDRAV
jgi:hypothetical protein